MAAGDPTPVDLGRRPIDLSKYRSVGIQPTDRSGTTRSVTDENNATLTHHWDDDARQDVTVRPKQVGVSLNVNKD